MPNPAAAVTMYTCADCGAQVFGFGAFGNHRKAHIAERRAAGDPAPARIRERRSRRIEDAGAALPGDGRDPSPPSPGSAGLRLDPDTLAGPDVVPPARVGRPSIASPSIRIGSDERQRSIDEAIRDALPISTLADIVRSLSVAISEADGAGEAGYLSPIQAAQVAALLHDSTIDLVVHRFGGDVNRFKAGLAAIIIVVAKGGVHVRAVAGRVEATRQARLAAGRAAAERPYQPPEGPAPTDDPIASAMALQRAQAGAQVGRFD